MLHIIPHQGNANENDETPLPIYYNGQNPEHGQHQMLTRMWSNRNTHSLLMGMQNGTATFKDRMAVSYQTEYILTKYSSNHVPWCLPK